MGPIPDLSLFHPEMARLWYEASFCDERNDTRGRTDLLLKSVLIAPSPWVYGRFFLWHLYTDSLHQEPHIVNESDMKAVEKMLSNDKEPALFRAKAAACLGVLTVDTDREGSLDYFRQVLEIVQCMPPEDADRPIIVPFEEAPNSTVGQEAKRFVDSVKFNLRVVMNPDDPESLDFVSKLRARHPERVSSFNIARCHPQLASFAPDLRKRLELGGNACDCCGKTLEELGLVRLNCCAKCKSAYYCGPDCQRKQWEAGHKYACRKPGQIKTMDFMIMRGLRSKPELNEQLAYACRIDPAKPGRWIVWASIGGELKEISVAITKLVHIRPAK